MIYLAAPEDALFHVIPHLKKATARHSLPLQDILDLLPHPLSLVSQETLIKAVCDCIPSSDSFTPDTYKLSSSRVLQILTRKVDALIPVLGPSIVAEFVDKRTTMLIGQEPPENITEIRDLAKRKCAMDIISSNLDDEFTELLYTSTEYSYPIQANLVSLR
jgi:Ydr279p protein family (RNase H2 complex component) wHTH domain